jgi:hypothetical protein
MSEILSVFPHISVISQFFHTRNRGLHIFGTKKYMILLPVHQHRLPPLLCSIADLRLRPPAAKVLVSLARIICFFRRLIFSRQAGENFCPPNPGFTLMINAKSTSGQDVLHSRQGCSRVHATPAFKPASLIIMYDPMQMGYMLHMNGNKISTCINKGGVS